MTKMLWMQVVKSLLKTHRELLKECLAMQVAIRPETWPEDRQVLKPAHCPGNYIFSTSTFPAQKYLRLYQDIMDMCHWRCYHDICRRKNSHHALFILATRTKWTINVSGISTVWGKHPGNKAAYGVNICECYWCKLVRIKEECDSDECCYRGIIDILTTVGLPSTGKNLNSWGAVKTLGLPELGMRVCEMSLQYVSSLRQ